MATRSSSRTTGSIRVEGDFEIVVETGKLFDLAGRDAIGLCRWGQSANKPFCDGSHARCGFVSPIEARALPPMTPKA